MTDMKCRVKLQNMKIQDVKLQDMKLQEMTNISLFLFPNTFSSIVENLMIYLQLTVY